MTVETKLHSWLGRRRCGRGETTDRIASGESQASPFCLQRKHRACCIKPGKVPSEWTKRCAANMGLLIWRRWCCLAFSFLSAWRWVIRPRWSRQILMAETPVCEHDLNSWFCILAYSFYRMDVPEWYEMVAYKGFQIVLLPFKENVYRSLFFFFCLVVKIIMKTNRKFIKTQRSMKDITPWTILCMPL